MILDPADGRKNVNSLDTRHHRPWNRSSHRVLDESVFMARPLENNLTFWFLSLMAHNLLSTSDSELVAQGVLEMN